MSETVTLADIEAAAGRLEGVVRRLPVHSARWLSDRVGGPVFLATENLQRAGSFKIRGAYNRLSQLSEAERAAGGRTSSRLIRVSSFSSRKEL